VHSQCRQEWQRRIESRLQSCEQRSATLGQKAGTTVAKVIEFYIPNNFRENVKWVPLEKRGKIIEFVSQMQESA
jgi:hypothetical protein